MDYNLIVGIITIGVSLWISLKILKMLFVLAKKTFGFFGPYIVSIIPSVTMYLLTTNLFGIGTADATITGFASAAIIGTIMNNS